MTPLAVFAMVALTLAATGAYAARRTATHVLGRLAGNT